MPDNRHADWREFRIFVDFFRKGGHQGADLTGIFSPKFRLKSGLTGQDFLQFSSRQLDADVCFINVFPRLLYTSYNVWMQGESVHPGLTERAQGLLNAAGIDWDLSTVPRHDKRTLCYGNFWVATPAFWEAFVGKVLDPIARFLEETPEAPIGVSVFDPAKYIVKAPYLPFIVERLFSTFLSLNPSYRTAPYPLPPDAAMMSCVNEFQQVSLRHLQPAVDSADAKGSFDEDLIKTQAVLGQLSTIYSDLYYQIHPHPHLPAPPRS
ncbi:hypothetical protein E5678_10610 [Hydrogenophaga sp. PAMC20947]|nr:hypothetical protein E5678_10610 [Hydrogenophaga sp. PAMC20947]